MMFWEYEGTEAPDAIADPIGYRCWLCAGPDRIRPNPDKV